MTVFLPKNGLVLRHADERIDDAVFRFANDLAKTVKPDRITVVAAGNGAKISEDTLFPPKCVTDEAI